MKTVEEILDGISDSRFSIPFPFNWDMLYTAINEARKEAIEECAERAMAFANSNSTDYKGKKTGIVDKESILSLIKELK